MLSKEISDSELKFAKNMQKDLGFTSQEIILSLKTCGAEKTLTQMEAVAKVRSVDISEAIKDFKENNLRPMQEN
ncbi:MAG: hypothetical protein WC875_01825 [Candidatus Absconditabacterales bacterium]